MGSWGGVWWVDFGVRLLNFRVKTDKKGKEIFDFSTVFKLVDELYKF